VSIWPWRNSPSRRYAGMVFSIRVKRPQSTAGRCWNVAQDVLSPIVVFTPIVLKLTGVITWSWWWVLSPMWISGILLVLGVCTLMIFLHWYARKQMRLFMDHIRRTGSPRGFMPGEANPDASGEDIGLQDGQLQIRFGP
jgi:hypothetical protein